MDTYDVIHLTKATLPLGVNRPGDSEIFEDYNDEWPRPYVLTAWKNGMPSAPIVAVPAAAGVQNSDAPVSNATALRVKIHSNPSAADIRFSYELEQPGLVHLMLYDVKGRKIRTITDDATGRTGRSELAWDGRDDSGAEMPRGVYIYRLEHRGQVATGKVVLIR